MKGKIKLLHLYHDIMNLYGEYGNICALARMLEKNHFDYELDRLSLNDEVKPMDYEFIYVGSGTERNQKCILPHLQALKEELRAYIGEGRALLMTGNSFELLGKSVTDAAGRAWQGLGLYPFTTIEQNRTRNTADAIVSLLARGDGHGQASAGDEENGHSSKEGQDIRAVQEREEPAAFPPLVGFINKCSAIEGIETPLFTVKMGLGNGENDSTEGIRHRNFFGTHLTGPLLIKNPHFLAEIMSLLCHCHGFSWDEAGSGADHLEQERAAYEVTLRELEKRLHGR